MMVRGALIVRSKVLRVQLCCQDWVQGWNCVGACWTSKRHLGKFDVGDYNLTGKA